MWRLHESSVKGRSEFVPGYSIEYGTHKVVFSYHTQGGWLKYYDGQYNVVNTISGIARWNPPSHYIQSNGTKLVEVPIISKPSTTAGCRLLQSRS